MEEKPSKSHTGLVSELSAKRWGQPFAISSVCCAYTRGTTTNPQTPSVIYPSRQFYTPFAALTSHKHSKRKYAESDEAHCSHDEEDDAVW